MSAKTKQFGLPDLQDIIRNANFSQDELREFARIDALLPVILTKENAPADIVDRGAFSMHWLDRANTASHSNASIETLLRLTADKDWTVRLFARTNLTKKGYSESDVIKGVTKLIRAYPL